MMRRRLAAMGALIVAVALALGAGAATPAAPSLPASQAASPLPEVRALPTDAAFLGPANCESCHEPNGRHGDEFEWYNTQDGVPGTNRLHKNALNQLADSEYERQSEAFARAIDPNVSDWVDFVYQPDGPCARCHATVVNGFADYGVTCESCHGPAQNYLEPHKEPDNRAASIAAGMWDIYGEPETWGAVCMSCHVLDDQRLIAAGHPDGADFDLGVKFQTTALHFLENRSTYSAGNISAIGDRYAGVIRADLPAVATPASAAATPPDDPADEPAATTAPAADPGPPAAAPAGRPAPVETRIVERVIERSVPTGTGAVVPVDPELQVVDALPPTPAAVVAAVQGRLATVLRVLLNNGAVAPQRITPEEEPVPYTGADAQLLRLQRQVIELALEALSRPQRQQDENR